ncbi:type I glyceraldehyde-3-phosphate dehydrogenase [Solitalea lacus]|uniref:type I glyceraldehyde-3-phosphate dehydrogenase n=1 Tax=Solitalea lacus TaxID=2911172 RepID=UPI001EDBED2F|nr:type I glyceraldehyde-3-phosphate dehydrogenase [Solitalea lacus]UKJ09379.1 type I glyceraldehyde-3-phosphate dehydrogenase [Solitalea lacus]
MRVAINGFGRIGRVFLRRALLRKEIEVVAINDLTDASTMAHLFKYDSIHRAFSGEVTCDERNLYINGAAIQIFNEKDPAHLPWEKLNIDVVIESTGKFTTKEKAEQHINSGAKRVIISAPSPDKEVPTIVLGVNEHLLNASKQIISNASCTTNNLAPMIKILDDLWGVESGYITTVHSYTGDQSLHDSPHKDLRRARAAAQSIIPTTTGAAKAITSVFPHLEGKLGGAGIRVPVPNGSLTDFTCVLRTVPSVQEINEAFLAASQNELKGILEYTVDPIVSVDVLGNPYSCVFDSQLTSVVGEMVKVVGWYDNEFGYSSRLVDLILKWYQV